MCFHSMFRKQRSIKSLINDHVHFMVMGWWKHLNPSLLGVPKCDKLSNGPLMSSTSSMQGQLGNVHGKDIKALTFGWFGLRRKILFLIGIVSHYMKLSPLCKICGICQNHLEVCFAYNFWSTWNASCLVVWVW